MRSIKLDLLTMYGSSVTMMRFLPRSISSTVLGFAGIEADPRLRGRDLRKAELAASQIVAAAKSPIDKDGNKRSIIDGGHKLIRNEASGRLELYALETDPAEENDLEQRAEMRDTVERLTALLSP